MARLLVPLHRTRFDQKQTINRTEQNATQKKTRNSTNYSEWSFPASVASFFNLFYSSTEKESASQVAAVKTVERRQQSEETGQASNDETAAEITRLLPLEPSVTPTAPNILENLPTEAVVLAQYSGFRKSKDPWTSEEVEQLTRGVLTHGNGKWTKILRDPDFHLLKRRDAGQLKDKWRNVSCYQPRGSRSI
jgi:hypothetical protein